MRSEFKKGLFYMILATIGFSIIPILASIGFSLELAPATLLFYRFMIAAVVFLFFSLVKKKKLIFDDKKTYIHICLSGFIYSVQCLLFFSAFEYISPSIGGIIYHIYPVFILFMAAICLKEPITKNKLAGVILSIIGISVVLYEPWDIAEIAGIILVILTAFVSSVYIVYNKKYTTNIDTVVLTTYLCIVCSFVFLAYSLLTGEFEILNTWESLVTASMLAFWSTIIGLFGFMKAISLLNTGLVSIISSCEPIFTIILSFLLLGVTISTLQIIGTIIVVIAIYVYERKPTT